MPRGRCPVMLKIQPLLSYASTRSLSLACKKLHVFRQMSAFKHAKEHQAPLFHRSSLRSEYPPRASIRRVIACPAEKIDRAIAAAHGPNLRRVSNNVVARRSLASMSPPGGRKPQQAERVGKAMGATSALVELPGWQNFHRDCRRWLRPRPTPLMVDGSKLWMWCSESRVHSTFLPCGVKRKCKKILPSIGRPLNDEA